MQVSVASVQVQPVPLMSVGTGGFCTFGKVSTTLTVPTVGPKPTLLTVIVHTAPVWPRVNVPLWVLVMARSGASTSIVAVAWLPEPAFGGSHGSSSVDFMSAGGANHIHREGAGAARRNCASGEVDHREARDGSGCDCACAARSGKSIRVCNSKTCRQRIAESNSIHRYGRVGIGNGEGQRGGAVQLNAGRAKRLCDAWRSNHREVAVLLVAPGPLSVDETGPVVLFCTPAAMPCTFTLTLQLAFAASVPPVRLIEPDPAAAVTVPVQVVSSPFGLPPANLPAACH